MTIADMPECACELLKAMKELFKDSGHFRDVLANEVIRLWAECAGLGWISGVFPGSSELADAVDGMSAAARRQVIAAICRAIKARC